MFVFIFSFITLVGSQDSNDIMHFADLNYVDGGNAFLTGILNGLRYPATARENCRIGKLKVKFSLDKDGNITSIDFLNKLGYDIEEDVRSVLLKTAGKWKSAEKIERSVILTVGYSLSEASPINGDITVSAIFPGGGECVTPEAELINEVTRLMRRKKFKKANMICEELLRRDPDSRHFIVLGSLVAKELKSN